MMREVFDRQLLTFTTRQFNWNIMQTQIVGTRTPRTLLITHVSFKSSFVGIISSELNIKLVLINVIRCD